MFKVTNKEPSGSIWDLGCSLSQAGLVPGGAVVFGPSFAPGSGAEFDF